MYGLAKQWLKGKHNFLWESEGYKYPGLKDPFCMAWAQLLRVMGQCWEKIHFQMSVIEFVHIYVKKKTNKQRNNPKQHKIYVKMTGMAPVFLLPDSSHQVTVCLTAAHTAPAWCSTVMGNSASHCSWDVDRGQFSGWQVGASIVRRSGRYWLEMDRVEELSSDGSYKPQHLSGLQTGWAGLMGKERTAESLRLTLFSEANGWDVSIEFQGFGIKPALKTSHKKPGTVSNYFLSLNQFSVEEPCCSFPMDFPHASRPGVPQRLPAQRCPSVYRGASLHCPAQAVPQHWEERGRGQQGVAGKYLHCFLYKANFWHNSVVFRKNETPGGDPAS